VLVANAHVGDVLQAMKDMWVTEAPAGRQNKASRECVCVARTRAHLVGVSPRVHGLSVLLAVIHLARRVRHARLRQVWSSRHVRDGESEGGVRKRREMKNR